MTQWTDEETPLLSDDASEGSTRSIHPLPGMRIRSHAIDQDCRLNSVTAKEAVSGARKSKGSFWIDIDADERDQEELKDWLKQLRLSPFLQTRLSEPPQTWASQVLTFDKTVFIVVRILPSQEQSDELAHMAALLLPNLILTFTSLPRCDTGGLYAQALARIHAHGGSLPDGSSSGALCAWLQFHVERTSTAARQLRSYTLQMDECMDREIGSVEKQEVIETKHQLMRVLAVAEEQLECIEALAEAEAGGGSSLDFQQLGGTFGVLKATASATERMVLRLNTHLSDLRQRHESHQHEAMNRRLAVLTVLSAVFLPLTLITGIWGMNFEYMPELKDPIAYPLALLAMVGIASSMICFFWRTGWFN